MGQVSTSHFEIFDYWKNKFITENGEVLDKCDNYLNIVVSDWGEPCCWACGKPVEVNREKTYQKAGGYESIWNGTKGKLERCHIHPASKGGKDEPSNLFLLCPQCHLLSPDTTHTRSFFRWIYKQRHQTVMGKLHPAIALQEIEKELEQRGITTKIEDILKLLGNEFDFSEAGAYFNENAGLHMTSLADSTAISVFTDYLVHVVAERSLT